MTNCTKNIFGSQSTSVRDSVGVGGDLLDVCIDRDKSRFVQVKFVTNSSQLLQHPPFAVSNVGGLCARLFEKRGYLILGSL